VLKCLIRVKFTEMNPLYFVSRNQFLTFDVGEILLASG